MKNDANSSLQFLPVPFGVFQTLKSSAGWVYLKNGEGIMKIQIEILKRV